MTFDAPVWLLAIALAIAVAVWDARRRWPEAAVFRGGRIGHRLGLIAILILAAAGPRCQREVPASAVVFLIDRSASIDAAQIQQSLALARQHRDRLDAQGHAALILFDSTPVIAAAGGQPWPAEIARASTAQGTDVEAALRLGMGLIPSGVPGRLVLISDGRATSGDIERAAEAARRRGIRIDVAATGPGPDDLALAGLSVDREARPGATVSGRARVVGPPGSSGRVTVRAGETVVVDADVALDSSGRAEIPFEHALDPGTPAGLAMFEVDVEPRAGATDPDRANNHAAAATVVGHPPRVMVIEGRPEAGGALAAALSAEGMAVDRLAPAEAVRRPLADVDVVVLADVAISSARSALPESRAREIAEWVSHGGGLIVLGGPSAYDGGGYSHSALDRVLPLDSTPDQVEIDPPVTMLTIVDRSGSMSEYAHGRTKIALALAGVSASLRLLRPFDRAGVVAVTSEVDWRVRFRDVSDPAAFDSRLRFGASGDGIYVDTALAAALEAFRTETTSIRHVILFSDAADSVEWTEGASLALAGELREAGITMSVIAIGSEQDDYVTFLRALARKCDGRFVITADAGDLEALFAQETLVAIGRSLRDGPATIVEAPAHVATTGVDLMRAPALRGYHALKARPDADVLAFGPDQVPLLAAWQVGLGRAVTWSSDAGTRWAADWLEWKGYPRLWTQIARWVQRRREGDAVAVSADVRGSIARVSVATREVEAHLRGQITRGSVTQPVDLALSADGLWRAEVPVPSGDAAVFELIGAGGEIVAQSALVAPVSPELAERSPHQRALADLAAATHGGWLSGSTALPEEGTVAESLPLWPLLLLIAVLLLPLDALLRRPAR